MIYDLSQPLFHDAPQWATYRSTSITLEYKRAFDGFNAERVSLTTHSGTHIDAPFHFDDAAETADQLPLDHFVSRAVVIDVRPKQPGSTIGVEDLQPLTRFEQPSLIVLLKTGWGEKRAKTKEYLLLYPYLTGDAAQFLVSRKVKGVGIDCLSIGGFEKGTGAPAHEVLLGAKKLIIEDLAIPEDIVDGKMRWFSAFPVKLTGTGGAWTRAVAWDLEHFA